MYRFIDHTADTAFEIVAETISELLRDASLAFYDAFAYVEELKADTIREVHVHEDSVDYLLYSWLNELLYLFDTEKFAGKLVEVEVEESDGFTARGVLKGDILSPEKVKMEPKAITLHNFTVEKRKDAWYAFVVVDI
ncbi:archease [Geoglobus acetivorans]|uniref:Archease n=1 Tax=Geoglobus acetivorans TaxID=565033 RepID=A0ABZ3H3K9_GEOAI|nr:archease [Geoglobus acetivorans]